MPPAPKTVDLAPSARPQTAGAPQGPRLTKDAPLAVRLAAVTTQVWHASEQHRLNLVAIRKAAEELGLEGDQIDQAFVAINHEAL